MLDGLLPAVGGFTGLPGRLTASMEVLNGGDWLLLSYAASPYAKSGIACAVLPNASEDKEEEMEEE